MPKPNSIKALHDIESITIEGVDFNLSEELKVTRENIGEIYEQHSEQVAYWGYQLYKAKARQRTLKQEAEQVWATRYRQFHSKLTNDSVTPTVDMVRSLTKMDKLVIETENSAEESEKEVDLLRMIVSAFEHRKACIMGLGALHRQELESVGGRTLKRRAPQF